VWFALPIFRALWSPAPPAQLPLARRRCLSLGDLVFWISMAAWSASGVTFPAWLHWNRGQVAARDYVHFLASHLLCGLIAGVFSFFLMALLGVRFFYPSLMEAGPPDAQTAGLSALGHRTARYMRLAVTLPFAGAILLGVGDSDFKAAFGGLAVLGAALLVVASRLTREIQSDLDAYRSFVTD
jgi:hypothetical protein